MGIILLFLLLLIIVASVIEDFLTKSALFLYNAKNIWQIKTPSTNINIHNIIKVLFSFPIIITIFIIIFLVKKNNVNRYFFYIYYIKKQRPIIIKVIPPKMVDILPIRLLIFLPKYKPI